jgi:hypothetical protein
MKRIPWILFLLSIFINAAGQRNAEYGVFAGASSYIGDINPGRPMYAPLPAAGLLYRYNFHPRQSLRGNIFLGGLRGNDLDFNNSFQTTRGESFSGYIGEAALQFEFNFLPYTTMGKLWDFTPYFAAGAGVVFVNTGMTAIEPVIPFSVGFKTNVHKNMGLEIEYGFRKTFYDNFDGLNDSVDPSDRGWIHNNDWYSFAGVVLTWKIYNKLAGCPVYDELEKGSSYKKKIKGKQFR